MGELGPIVAMSLLLSQQYTTLQEFGFLMVFLAVVILASATSLGLRPPSNFGDSGPLHAREFAASGTCDFAVVCRLFALLERLGFEKVLGAFAAEWW